MTLVDRSRRRAATAIGTAWFRAHGVACPPVRCEGRPPVIRRGGEVILGAGVMFRSVVIRPEVGAVAGGRLEIGDGAFLNQGVVAVATRLIRIGAGSRIADLVAIYDTHYHPLDDARPVRQAPVLIGENVWVGRGAVILPGSVIGDNSVVGAGAVVNGDVAPDAIAVGVPARVVGALSCPRGWTRP